MIIIMIMIIIIVIIIIIIIEVLEAATRIGIHRRCFLRDNLLRKISSPKASRNCLWWGHFIIKTPQPTQTSLRRLQDVLKRSRRLTSKQICDVL